MFLVKQRLMQVQHLPYSLDLKPLDFFMEDIKRNKTIASHYVKRKVSENSFG